MNVLIIAEKDSAAMDIAKGLGSPKKEKGYYTVEAQNNVYRIVYTFGHTLGVANETNREEKWSIERLPIFPDRFEYTPISAQKAEIIRTAAQLAKEADEIIIATDAGREGELIGRQLLYRIMAKPNTQLSRFWTSEALSEAVVKKVFGQGGIKPLKQFDHVYQGALARQHADWVVGINLTRYFSIRSRQLVSVGRVQTPLVALIAQRCAEHGNFQKKRTFSVGFYLNGTESCLYDGTEQKETQEEATELMRSIQLPLTVTKYEESAPKRSACPPLYSLSSLQEQASARYGYTAKETLEIAQRLYEHYKVLSYPRTDSERLAESNRSLFADALSAAGYSEYASRVGQLGKEVFDDTKLTDHHALIVLSAEPSEADEREKNIYSLVLKRMLNFFHGPYVYSSIRVELADDKGHTFERLSTRVIEKGWRAKDEDSTAEEKELVDQESAPQEGEKVEGTLGVVEHVTRPPDLYTDGTLIKLMKKLNLGAPSSRDSIIEKVLERDYVIRNKKKFEITTKGKSLLEALKGSDVVQPEMTSKWEEQLEAVRTEEQYSSFMEGIKGFVREELKRETVIPQREGLSEKQLQFLTKLAKEKGVKVDVTKVTPETFEAELNRIKEEGKITCSCGGEVKEGEKAFFCPNCKSTVYRAIAGKTVPRGTVVKLFAGEEILLKGMKSKAGNAFDAKLKLINGKVEFQK